VLRILLLFILTSTWILNTNTVSQAEYSGERISIVESAVEATHWQLVKWKNNETVCNIFVQDHRLPNNLEIINYCGIDVLQTWINTPVCPQALAGYGSQCTGLFQRNLGNTTISVKKVKKLPTMSFAVSAPDCQPGNWCTWLPKLRINANEPVDGHKITQLHLALNGREKIYSGANSELFLPLTGENGNWIEYWADSSFGDQSKHFRMKYRNFQPDPKAEKYRFDLLSQDWSKEAPSASLIWNIFPPVTSELPLALEQPRSVSGLTTLRHYNYLAGHLIQSGQVNAGGCNGEGLLTGGVANSCGMSAAYKENVEWQNKYDSAILAAAKKYNIPARVIKGIIAQETQFWPISNSPYELGLGKITENGVDMLLMWNSQYYLATCTTVYSEVACAVGYSSLAAYQQSVLRSTVLKKVQGNEQIDILAAILLASATQTNQMLLNTIQIEPENSVSYEDMWRITIGNYNVGSGCVSVGMRSFPSKGAMVTWDKLIEQMVGNCQNAKDYVEKVFEFSE